MTTTDAPTAAPTEARAGTDRRDLDLLFMAGDGIGQEITSATQEVLQVVLGQHGVAWRPTEATIGFDALRDRGTTMPDDVLEQARTVDGTVLGPVSHLDYPTQDQGGVNPSGLLRRHLDLFANIRPARTVTGLPSPLGRTFDLVIVRENTEGFYADRTMYAGTGEVMPTEDLALAFRKVTRSGSERIVRKAFELALTRPRPKVTVIHKANVLRISDGLFLEEARRVREDFPDVEYEELLVDAVAALLIRRPETFEVLVTTNMFGDILSDEATELSGSIGLAASLNVGTDHAMAQAQHGSAPDIAGQGIANPASLIGSSAMLLTWLGQRRDDLSLLEAGRAVTAAVDLAAADRATRTRDLGGQASTARFTAAVIDHLRSQNRS